MKLIGLAVVLALGLALSATPLTTAQPRKAGVVTDLAGTVTLLRAGSRQPVGIKAREDIFVNDHIVTGDNSFVSLLLGGRADVVMRGRSALRLTEVPFEAFLDVDSGKVLVAITENEVLPGGRLAVRTGNAVVRFPDAVFASVEFFPGSKASQETRVHVSRGTATVSTGSGGVQLSAMRSVTVTGKVLGPVWIFVAPDPSNEG